MNKKIINQEFEIVIKLFFFLLIIVSYSCSGGKAIKEKPNILLILSDDQGFCELGAYMDFADPSTLAAWRIDEWKKVTCSTPIIAPIEVCFEAARKCMPNVDRIASEGVRFTSFYTAATCAPSRAALMTGCYPQRYGIYSNGDVKNKRAGGLSTDATLAVELFRAEGYITGLSGKWHLGSDSGHNPLDRGFDFFFGFDSPGTNKYDSKDLMKNGKSEPARGWLADQITDEAIGFLEMADKEEKPFFLYVAYNEPHGPTPRPPQEYIDYINSGSDIVDVHFAAIYGMDVGIGRILEKLEKMGEMENTLILYGSDNGGSEGSYYWGFSVKGPDFWDSSSRESAYLVPIPLNGPLQGCKFSSMEGGIRVPFIARIPGGEKGSSNTLRSIMDVMPTALEYADIPVSNTISMDGESFMNILKNSENLPQERTLFWAMPARPPYGEFGPVYDSLKQVSEYRVQEEIRLNAMPAWYVRTPKWKLMGWDTLSPVLIDIDNDIGEQQDLSSDYPDLVKALTGEFSTWINQQIKPVIYPVSEYEKFNF